VSRGTTESREILIDGLPVRVTRKRIRNLRMTVRAPEGEVRVSVPLFAGDREVRRFIREKREWIDRHRQQIILREAARPAEPEYAAGDSIPFRGGILPLMIRETDPAGRPFRTARAVRDGDVLILSVPPGSLQEKRKAAVDSWYRRELRAAIPPLAEKWTPRIGRMPREWRIRSMRTRWGTCNIPAGRIWLNLELIKKPPRCLEYVLVHEMVHLLERNHNRRFRDLMDRFLPDWRDRKRELEC